MKKNQRQIFLLVSFVIVMSLTALSLAQKSNIDNHHLNRNIRIMEGILDKIFEGKTSTYTFDGKTKGLYIQDFGVVFYTHLEGSSSTLFPKAWTKEWKENIAKFRQEQKRLQQEQKRLHEEAKKLYQQRKKLLESINSKIPEAEEEITAHLDTIEESSSEKLEEEQKTIEALKGNILVFFQKYAPAMSQLRAQDRIAVLVNLKDWKFTESENAFLAGWLTQEDLNRYHKKQLSKSDFSKLVHFQLTDAQTYKATDIDIMTEILGRALDTSSYRGGFSNTGIHLDGLGVLLFINIPVTYWSDSEDHNSYSGILKKDIENFTSYISGEITEKEKKEQQKLKKERFQRIQDNLFELLTSYGHTLSLMQQEQVVLNVNLEHGPFIWNHEKSPPSHLILQMRKKDLDDYNKGILSLTDLRKKLVFHTY